ncbi:MAG: hypothetical protein OQJ95_04865 [Kangiella sp.]|jgi:hypothetical protein|nr:hypothetical protein [Kangiella sp.]
MTIHKLTLGALLLSGLTINTLACAQQEAEISGILGGGISFGGETLVDNIRFSDGSSDEVKTGEGFWLDFGFRAHFQDWALKSTLGYKSGGVFASNGDATFSRLPLTMIASLDNNGHLFGAGFTYELNPELELDLPGLYGTAEFENALGLVLEYENNYDTWGWGVRYTHIDYDYDATSETFDGNNIGAFFNWYF